MAKKTKPRSTAESSSKMTEKERELLRKIGKKTGRQGGLGAGSQHDPGGAKRSLEQGRQGRPMGEDDPRGTKRLRSKDCKDLCRETSSQEEVAA